MRFSARTAPANRPSSRSSRGRSPPIRATYACAMPPTGRASGRGAPRRDHAGLPGTVAHSRHDGRREHLVRRGADAARTISRARINQRTRDLFAVLGLPPIQPDRPVRSLSSATSSSSRSPRAGAGSRHPHPRRGNLGSLPRRSTGFSTSPGSARAASSCSISHRLAEVRRVADRVTVLRNGETVGTEATAASRDDEIVSMMLGRRLDRLFPKRRHGHRPVALAVDRLRSATGCGARLALHEGEVLGVAGLQGHGQRELFMALFGPSAQRAGSRSGGSR